MRKFLSEEVKRIQESRKTEKFPLKIDSIVPFESERGFMATLHQHDHQRLIFVKCAPEKVLDMCAETSSRGMVERIGGNAMLKFVDHKGASLQETASVTDHKSATRQALDWLGTLGYLGVNGLDAVGY